MKSLSIKTTALALAGMSYLYAHGTTNSWGKILYTRYQESKVYYSQTTSATVLKTLAANETVKADFKEGKFYAIFKPSETSRSVTNVVGYMEEADLFLAPLPPGPITNGVGNAPPVKASVEGMRPIPNRPPLPYVPIKSNYTSGNSDKEIYDNFIKFEAEKLQTQMERAKYKRQVELDIEKEMILKQLKK